MGEDREAIVGIGSGTHAVMEYDDETTFCQCLSSRIPLLGELCILLYQLIAGLQHPCFECYSYVNLYNAEFNVTTNFIHDVNLWEVFLFMAFYSSSLYVAICLVCHMLCGPEALIGDSAFATFVLFISLMPVLLTVWPAVTVYSRIEDLPETTHNRTVFNKVFQTQTIYIVVYLSSALVTHILIISGCKRGICRVCCEEDIPREYNGHSSLSNDHAEEFTLVVINYQCCDLTKDVLFIALEKFSELALIVSCIDAVLSLVVVASIFEKDNHRLLYSMNAWLLVLSGLTISVLFPYTGLLIGLPRSSF